MNARDIIFSDFSLNVGSPIQYPVHNREQFNRFISLTSGISDDCYASTCFYQDKKPVFHDIFLETDSMNLDPIIKVCVWYNNHNIPWIPLFSGNRGIHIHALFAPEIINALTVQKFANMIIKETHTEGKFDSHVTGDLRRLARIPNTKRINELWCIPLSCEDIMRNITSAEILALAKSPQLVQYNITRRPRITEFIKDEKPQNIEVKYNIPLNEKSILKDVLRPCVYEKLMYTEHHNPRDNTRITATVEALTHGVAIKNLINIYEKLNWADFDRDYTRYQIENINERVLAGTIKPFGKKKMGCTKKGACIQCVLREG